MISSRIRFETPTWNQVYAMLLNLAQEIREDGFEPDVIVGVCRGGWPPARVLSDLLSVADLANVRVEFYVGVAETKGEPSLTQPVSVNVSGKKVLVVDEVADTGRSLELVKRHLTEQGAREVRIATVYHKPWSAVRPDYCAKKTSKWIVFPWEIKETLRKIVKKSRETGKSPEKETDRLAKAGIPARLVKRFLREVLREESC